MIELEKHIEILLLGNDCVIVPGLGGFMAHHMEARYDESEQLFLPPFRTLGFNPQLTMNDSLLAQSYIEAYDISYPEALRRIEEEVMEIKQHIEANGFYELNDIGVLKLNDEGHYEFQPCEAGILTPELYGLGAFDMPKLAMPLLVEPVADEAEVNVALNSILTASAPMLDVVDNQDTVRHDSEHVRTITIPVSWIRNTVAVAAAILAFFFITTPVDNSIQENVQSSSVLPIISNDASQSATKSEPQQKEPTTQQQEETAKAATPAKAEVAAESSNDYLIVIASQVSLTGAEEYVAQLKNKGYKDAAVYVRNNVVRVVYGSYPTESMANDTLRKLHRNDAFEDAWILKK